MKGVITVLCALAFVRDAHADAKAEAQVFVDRAKTLHAEGKLAEALAALKEAYVLDPRPELLFGIAQIHVGLGQCTEAITFYERYLSTKPDVESTSVTREAIQACKDKPDAFVKPAPKPDPKPVPGEPPPPELPPWYSDWVADGLIVGGVIAGVAAGVVYGSARSDRDAADDVTSFQQYSDLIDDAKGKRNTAIVLGVVGTGLIAGGIVKWMLRERSVRRHSRDGSRGHQGDTFGIAPSAGGGMLTWTRGL